MAEPPLEAPRRVRLVVSAPPWVWLAGIVVVSALFRYVLSRQIVSPWIMIDELVYSELAKSFAATGHFLIRDEHFARYGPIYPALISPAYRVFTSVPHAYSAAKAINAVAMSLAAVPAYALGRRFLSPGLALAGALLAVAVPSMAYTGTLMTENAAYPIVLTAVLALVLTLERPTLVRALVTLALTGLAILTRLQALALVPAIAAAPVFLVLLRRRARELLRYLPLYVPLAAVVVGVVATELARGQKVTGLLGVYSFVPQLSYSPGSIASWSIYTLDDLDLYVGVAPLAALLVLLALGRRWNFREQAFLATTVAVTCAFVVEAGTYTSAVSYFHRVAERYAFYPAPLLVLALLLWISRGMPRPWPVAVPAALVAAALPATLPLGRLLVGSVSSDTLALIPWLKVREHVAGPTAIRVIIVVGSVAAAALFLALSRRLAFVLPVALLAYFAVVLVAVQREFRFQAEGAITVASNAAQTNWIDETVGPGARVAAVWSQTTNPHAFWTTEFFNRSVGAVYDVRQPLPGDLPERPLAPVATTYALADRSVTLAGVPVATSPLGEFTLYRTGRLRVLSVAYGRYAATDWYRPRVTYVRYGCGGGTLTARLTTDPRGFPNGETVAAEGRSVRVGAGWPSDLKVPLRPHGGRCVVHFRSQPVVQARIPWGPQPHPVGAEYMFAVG